MSALFFFYENGGSVSQHCGDTAFYGSGKGGKKGKPAFCTAGIGMFGKGGNKNAFPFIQKIFSSLNFNSSAALLRLQIMVERIALGTPYVFLVPSIAHRIKGERLADRRTPENDWHRFTPVS